MMQNENNTSSNEVSVISTSKENEVADSVATTKPKVKIPSSIGKIIVGAGVVILLLGIGAAIVAFVSDSVKETDKMKQQDENNEVSVTPDTGNATSTPTLPVTNEPTGPEFTELGLFSINTKEERAGKYYISVYEITGCDNNQRTCMNPKVSTQLKEYQLASNAKIQINDCTTITAPSYGKSISVEEFLAMDLRSLCGGGSVNFSFNLWGEAEIVQQLVQSYV